LSILVIEGDRTLAKLFTDIFELQEWKADSCCNADDSMALLKSTKEYDVILTSYRVPGTDGLELLRFIRSLGHRNGTPVIMITGSSGIEYEALAAGAAEVVKKPVDMSGITAAVRRHVPNGKAPIELLSRGETLSE
jgi:DNA-binding response OmpR family regulator